MRPTNPLSDVRQLAATEERCEFYRPVLTELRQHGMDTDDLRALIECELGDTHCYETKPTEKYHPGTVSDYYSVWVEDCRSQMFLKLLVATDAAGARRLVVTSFKKDLRYEP